MNKALGFHFAAPPAIEPVSRDSLPPGTMYSHTATPTIHDVQVALKPAHPVFDKRWVQIHPHVGVNLVSGEVGFALGHQMVYPLAATLTVSLAAEW